MKSHKKSGLIAYCFAWNTAEAGRNFRNIFLCFLFYSCFFNVLFTYANSISVQFNFVALLKVCIGYSHRPFFSRFCNKVAAT